MRTGRAVEGGVTEGEHAAVGSDQPVPAVIGSGGHAHDRGVEMEVPGRTEEGRVAEVEDAAVGSGHPQTLVASRIPPRSCSINVCRVVLLPTLVAAKPAAKHPMFRTQATPPRDPKATTLGLGWTDQVEPFQFSMNGLGLTLLLRGRLGGSGCPAVRGIDTGHRVQDVRRGGRIGARSRGPGRTVPVLHQGGRRVALGVHGRTPPPSSRRSRCRSPSSGIDPVGLARCRCRDDRPRGAVPVLGQRRAADHVGVDTGQEVVLDLVRARRSRPPSSRRSRCRSPNRTGHSADPSVPVEPRTTAIRPSGG